ncbi:DUF4357 domain-containing protein [Streptomyces katsurahamanus]|uniref:DUF4357 domain-containing protein n=1 Tax=Streptomyces katsurahamanus TaxID=2577098 RepID=A0ABW9NSN5_9ACTN|nr:DUF4357 domain-containing protein [Streptomyces katsurahamanus]
MRSLSGRHRAEPAAGARRRRRHSARGRPRRPEVLRVAARRSRPHPSAGPRLPGLRDPLLHSSTFPSPSKAAEAVTGNIINGWTLWQTPDGSTLDQLRQKLDAE